MDELLQWGRGLATAEGDISSSVVPLPSWLQWGRGLATAEGPHLASIPKLASRGFNGAAVSRPRKGGRARAMSRGLGRFNGAAVSRPRKGHCISANHYRYVWLQWGRGLATAEGKPIATNHNPRWSCFNGAAVSRPRKARVEPSVSVSLLRLQWGRGLATAEGCDALTVHVGGKWLQWGRGLATAEGHRTTTREVWTSHASMGPRSRDRGRPPGDRVGLVRSRASMGPRSRDRGREFGPVDPELADGGFNGAAVSRPRKGTGSRPPNRARGRLQWGRGLATAEGRLSKWIRAVLSRGFNGAAVSRPRKGRIGDRSGHEPFRFNGAAVSRPRKDLKGASSTESRFASMGPRSRDRGRMAARPSALAARAGFNGAAVSRPRKERGSLVLPSKANSLQWGRGLATAEGTSWSCP